MRNRSPVYRDPVLHFDALRLIALREGGKMEGAFPTENAREVLIRAPFQLHSARTALCWAGA